jgi:peptidoglycan/LPS O-acetylase OafA/YrhL
LQPISVPIVTFDARRGTELYNTEIPSALQTAPSVTLVTPVMSPRARAVLPSDYLPALTGLRFWLAVWVILHHICGRGMLLEPWANGLPAPMLQLIRGGYLAVQTFFVLSGFVLARTYAHAKWDRQSLGRFFTARFARIYPVYLVSLILMSPFMIEMMLTPAWTGAHRANLLANYVLVLQGWTGALGVGWNTPAWSLSCEFFFYLWFPVLFVALRNARWRAIAASITVAILLPIMLDHAGVPWSWKPLYHVADFIAGLAAARIFALIGTRRAWNKRGYWLYIPAAVLGGWLIIHRSVVDGSGADLNTYLRPLNVALLVGFALNGGTLAKWLSGRAMDFLGKASYSMYVLHVPILWWTGRYLVHGNLHLTRPVGATIYLTLVVVVSGMIYQWFEAPASAWIRARQKRLGRG